ncbi:MAG: prephenate dehydratase [Oscillospiraceae bacterium]|nr:prephenate dehydratase [Oscillospiraceae bacterium]MDD4413111.1 prephenate dehydratase [Oscillospiraceae bacterium]
MDLSDIRREIDTIDAELIQLICRRMDCAQSVAEYKAANNMAVLNQKREEEIIERVKRSCDDYRDGYGNAAAIIFASMMDASRALQHQVLAAGAELRNSIDQAKRRLIPSDRVRIACQGIPGAYSDEAANKIFPGTRPRFYETFEDVFSAVRDEQADYGILPVENSSAGSVNEVYDLVMKYRFTIAAAVELPINHCLLGLPGTDLQNLKAVYSHPQGLAQCGDFIARHHLEPRPFINTAAAARMVAESGDASISAIASSAAAGIYGLQIIEENIQSIDNNNTRFIVISRDLVISDDANKISLIFALPHVTGSLYRILSRFAMAGLNLTKLESRPQRSGGFEYLFYIDFEGNFGNPATIDLLCALSEELPSFSFIGNYKEMD